MCLFHITFSYPPFPLYSGCASCGGCYCEQHAVELLYYHDGAEEFRCVTRCRRSGTSSASEDGLSSGRNSTASESNEGDDEEEEGEEEEDDEADGEESDDEDVTVALGNANNAQRSTTSNTNNGEPNYRLVSRSLIPINHPHFLTGLFKPRTPEEEESTHPHGAWRWLTGMADGALRQLLIRELRERGIEISGSRHCLIRKYLHATACEDRAEAEGMAEERARSGLPYCFQCALPCGSPTRGAPRIAKRCSRANECHYTLCESCHNRNLHDDANNRTLEGGNPASFGSFCYFCGGESVDLMQA